MQLRRVSGCKRCILPLTQPCFAACFWACDPLFAPPSPPTHASSSPPFLQRPPLVDHTEMTRFHSDDYINFLRVISPDNMQDHLRELQRCE